MDVDGTENCTNTLSESYDFIYLLYTVIYFCYTNLYPEPPVEGFANEVPINTNTTK